MTEVKRSAFVVTAVHPRSVGAGEGSSDDYCFVSGLLWSRCEPSTTTVLAADRSIPKESIATKVTAEALYLHESMFPPFEVNRSVGVNSGGARAEPEGEGWKKLQWLTCHGAPFTPGVGIARCAAVQPRGVAFNKWQVAAATFNWQ